MVPIPNAGEGRGGIDGIGPFLEFVVRPAKVNVVGVLGEMSDPSGLETDRLRFFKLDEERFFLMDRYSAWKFDNWLGGPAREPGSIGLWSFSICKNFRSPGGAVERFVPGRGDDIFRIAPLVASAGSGIEDTAASIDLSGIAEVVFGGNGTTVCSGTFVARGAMIGCVWIEVSPGVCLFPTSMVSDSTLSRDNRLPRTP